LLPVQESRSKQILFNKRIHLAKNGKAISCRRFPKEESKACDGRKGPAILTTTDENSIPNAVYVICVSKVSKDTIVVADNYLGKT